jgi:hypothetical protein
LTSEIYIQEEEKKIGILRPMNEIKGKIEQFGNLKEKG